MDNNRKYRSIEEWKQVYFPKLVKEEKFEKIKNDPKALGKAYAEESLEKVKSKFEKLKK